MKGDKRNAVTGQTQEQIEARHLIITGKVQSVAYRSNMVLQAKKLGVTGWVRNLNNGSVEAVIAGTLKQIIMLIAWARRGPPAAQVTNLVVEQIKGGPFPDFRERPTL